MKTTYYSILPFVLACCYVMWYHPILYFLLPFVVLARFFCIFRRSLKVSSKGKDVLITGCDTGFGHQLAISLRKAGFTVFACCLDNQSEGEKNLESLSADTGEKLHLIKMDVTNQKQVDDALNYVEKNLPKSGLWGLVNNAGVVRLGYIEWISMDQFEQMASVNLFGSIRVTKDFAPLIRKSKGRIVNVSSVFGRYATSQLSAYCITKHGVEAFSNVCRREMRRFGVKVCTIQPGNFTNTTGLVGKIDGGIKIINRNWDNLSLSLKENYGRQTVEDTIALRKRILDSSLGDVAPVVNTMTDCFCRLYPETHHLVGTWVDKTLVYLYEYLPACIMDRLLSFLENISLSQSK